MIDIDSLLRDLEDIKRVLHCESWPLSAKAVGVAIDLIQSRRLIWTHERPKVVGRYWVRKNKEVLGIVWTDKIVSGEWLWLPSYECAGPIPEGEEPNG